MKTTRIIVCAALAAICFFSCEKAPSEPKTIAVEGISVSPETHELEVGEQFALTVTITPEDASNKNVGYHSSKIKVATVNADGLVEAVGEGKAIISAISEDGEFKAYSNVTVVKATGVTTGGADHISCRNAVLSGTCSREQENENDFTFGIVYSTSEDLDFETSAKVEAGSMDASCNYSITTDTLDPETTYYYCGYINRSKGMVYGAKKSFTTLSAASLIQTGNATDISTLDATVHGSVNLSDCVYQNIECGFDITPDGGQTYTVTSDNLSLGQFSYHDNTLSLTTKYSFAAFAKLDGTIYRGEVKEFTTNNLSGSITASSSLTGCKTSTISGKLTVDSTSDIKFSTTVYYSNKEPSLEGLKSNGSKKTATKKAGDYMLEVKGLKPSTKYYYAVVAEYKNVEIASGVGNFTTTAAPSGAVDLGLSVLWATCNLGADTEYQPGRLYAFGDTTGQLWNGQKGKWEKSYGFSHIYDYKLDSNNNLLPETDAASVNLGGSWRIPSSEDFRELVDNTSYSVKEYGGKPYGVFTSKVQGYTDKFICMPLGGYGTMENWLYNNESGRYATRTFYGERSMVLYYFGTDSDTPVYNGSDMVMFGYSVRPVAY